jgi:hypothetical protein
VEAQPGFYSASSEILGSSFNVPLIIGGSYLYSKDLQLVLGVSIDATRKYPVLPGGGVRWQINHNWLLNAVLPKPRLELKISKRLTAYLGGDVEEAAYRTDENFGRAQGRSELSSSWIDFTEVRAGGGAVWDIAAEVKLELEAGALFYRQLDYHKAGVDLHSSDTAPYGHIGFSAKF